MDVTLEFLNAAHGDAIIATWGDPPRLAIVDGGPTGSFERALGPRLEQIRLERTGGLEQPLPVDLVCVSHIDDDHIAGIVRFLTDIRRRQRDQLPAHYRVDRMWHNSFEELIVAASTGASVVDIDHEVGQLSQASGVVAASVNQGRDVRDLGRSLGITRNAPFEGPIIAGVTTTLFGLDIAIASPEPGALDRLEKIWRKAKRSKDASVLAASFTDRSVPNLSSICSVVGGPNGRALMTADARGDRVMAGLEALGILSPGGTAHFDVLQVPHHGSANNSEAALFQRITADHYVISADGIKHAHPDPAVLDWIVNARGPDAYAIHLTNTIPSAVTQLQRLASGRNFTVESRTDPAPSIVVNFSA